MIKATTMNNLKLEYWEPTKLIGYIKNPRKNDQVIQRMVESISEFGFTIPVLAKSDGSVIDGHLRLKAAIKMKMEQVPVVIADHLSESQIKAFRLLANRSANWAEWDEDLLKVELLDLKNSAFDLSLTGFDTKELDQLLVQDVVETKDDGEEATSKADELQQKWQVKLGDVFECGYHRIACGDCSDQSLVLRLLQTDSIQLLLTDPPYGVKMDKGFSGGGRSFGGKEGKQIVVRSYTDEWDSERPSKAVFDSLLSLAKESIVWGGNFFADILPMSTHWLVWDKHQTMPTFGDCELAWTSIKRKSIKKYDVEYNGLIGKEKERFHPTQKPLKLFEQVIVDYTKPNELILDSYGGSGTTMIACQSQGRIARLIERSPEYVAVTLERYSALTNETPRLL